MHIRRGSFSEQKEKELVMKKKVLIVALSAVMAIGMSVGLTGCGSGSSSGGSGKTVTLHFASSQGTTHVWYKEAKKFKENVEKDSDGTIKVALEFGGVDGSDKDTAEGVQSGTIDMYIGSTVGFDTSVPKIGFVNLPYFINSYDKVDKLIYNGWVGETIKKDAEDAGFKILGLTDCDFRWLSTKKKLVKSAADLKGLKMRVPESPMFVNFFKNLGAKPTTMAFTEVPSALQQGTIDGQDNGPTLSYPNGLQQFNKYWVKSNHSFASAVVAMNPDSWSKLSKDQQEVLQKNVDEYCENIKTGLRAEVKEDEKKMVEEDNCKVIEPTAQLKADMKKAAYKVWQDKKVTKTFDQDAVKRMLKEAGLN